MFATTSAARQRRKHLPAWAALLERFYAREGLPLPRLHLLRKDEIPEPYRGLLVHTRDMTPTLEGFYRQPMRLTVLSRERQNGVYLREVILKRAAEAPPVEYGVIRICLDHLPEAARQKVLEEERPLGNILQTEAIPHTSRPEAFFRTEADAHMSAVLCLRRPCVLYGRSNILLDDAGRVLAEVLEVLAPDEPRAEG
jgi:chorismate-pyruvate lyase